MRIKRADQRLVMANRIGCLYKLVMYMQIFKLYSNWANRFNYLPTALISIQTAWQSDGISERIFQNSGFWIWSIDDQNMKFFPVTLWQVQGFSWSGSRVLVDENLFFN